MNDEHEQAGNRENDIRRTAIIVHLTLAVASACSAGACSQCIQPPHDHRAEQKHECARHEFANSGEHPEIELRQRHACAKECLRRIEV